MNFTPSATPISTLDARHERRFDGEGWDGWNDEWNDARLRDALSSSFPGESIVVLANRQPFRHDRADAGGVEVRRSAGGLVTALEPLLQASSGVWVAHGAGTADPLVVDARDGVDVPPANPQYRLRRVWLDADEERRYYYGFANQGLWPLCHRTTVAPRFKPGDFATYAAVNARFADAVCEEIDTDRPLVLVQDYHFALAPDMIRRRMPRSSIVTFWHIPWPTPGRFAECPVGRSLLRGLLGSTILGFQTPDDVENFIATARAELGAHVSRAGDAISYAGHHTIVRDYPVSIEWPNRWAREAPPVETCRLAVHRELGLAPDVQLVVGVDRLDYTKGLHEKLLAIERLFERAPRFRGRVAFAQIAEPSRSSLRAYRDLRTEVLATAQRVNARFRADGHDPITILEAHHDPADVYRFLRAADVCYVGSLHDGMNLVAKEFAAARDDERGVLMLSRFAGAARELRSAVIIDPYAIDDCADALARALDMSPGEQCRRMRAMRAAVAFQNTYRWAGTMLADAARLRASELEQVDGDAASRSAERIHA